MKVLQDYLQEHTALIVYITLCFVLCLLFFFMYGMPSETFSYFTLLYVLLAAIYLGYDLKKYALFLSSLQQESKTDLHSPMLDCLQEVIQKEERLRLDLMDAQSQEKEQLADTFVLWVHQAKLPLATLKLISEEENPDPMEIKQQIFRMEQEMDKVMAIVRMDDVNSDYQFEWVDVLEIVRSLLRSFRTEFILRKLHLDLEGESFLVLSDKKWLSFALEQVLSNACKYTKDTIRIYLDESKATLRIEDNGKGILASDFMRILEKGYTGHNGHASKESSGLGLYLFQKTMKNLGHRARLSNLEQGGFCVEISFLSPNDLLQK
jgi:hypothetical protein